MKIVKFSIRRLILQLHDRSNFVFGVLSLSLLCFFFALSKSQATELVNNLSFDLYSHEQGLSNDKIHCVYQDSKGWIWIGTSQGICRFDGYRFTAFKSDPDDPSSLKGDMVRVIFEDHKHQLWIGTDNGGLNKFNREKETFQQLSSHENLDPFKDASVYTIVEDLQGNMWVGTETNLVKIEDETKLTIIKPNNHPGFSNIREVRIDKKGRIWVATIRGIFLYDPVTKNADKLKLGDSFENEEVWEIMPDEDGTFWIGTNTSGLYTINSLTLKSNKIVIDPNNERSNSVRAISKSPDGKYWIGTRGGLYRYDKFDGVIEKYFHDDREPRSLANNSIQCLSLDVEDNLWIGTRQGLNLLVEERTKILGYKSMPDDNRYLNNGEIYSFMVDQKGNIWIGTENGGINILNRNSGRFSYMLPQRNNPNSISSNCVKALLDDGKGNIWIGTFMGGLDVYNTKTGVFKHFKNDPSDPNSLSDNRIWALLKDSNNDILIGTSNGIDKFNPATGGFTKFPNLVHGQHVNWLFEDKDHCLWIGADSVIIYNPKNQSVKKINEHTLSMFEDSRNRYWLATLNRGIALCSKEEGITRYYNVKNGLANNQALAILEDNEKFLWISTISGLSKFDPEKGRFHNFTTKNGFQNDQFTYRAAIKLPSGELVFGGVSGFNIFDPAKIKSDDYFAPIHYTNLKVMNKSVKIGDSSNDILTKCISETEKIVLKYEQNSVEVEFASLDFANIIGVQYAYYLKGFDKDWNEPSDKRIATYTNLNPGHYTLHIKTISIDRQQSKSGPDLQIIVLPPFWLSWWFRISIFLAILGLTYWLITFLKDKEMLKHNLAFEKVKAEKLHELDMMKLQLYTNISHEIRTPLSLLIGPLEKMKSHSIPAAEMDGHVEIMYRNANQLKHLINQLLDYRKIESGSMKLNLKRGDLVSFIADIVETFRKYAEEKKIELKFNSVTKEIVTNFDDDKIVKIVNNLLSNAVKFTPENGKITITISLIFNTNHQAHPTEGTEERMIELSVKDTGIGISESNLEKIFDRFFQVEENSAQIGTGIGLALTKELVKLHNGNIFVTSKEGEFSKFTVQLPYYEFPLSTGNQNNPNTTEEAIETENSSSEEHHMTKQSFMLLVDDNADVRYFIKAHFSKNYQVLEAKDGVEGWNVALKTIPNIIISDVMMPDMDGFEFCRKIRKDERTSHIPILLLTALGSREHEIEGLSQGADDYITKPFDLVILQAKIENILSVRQSLKQKYSGEMLLQPRNVLLSSPDERFLQKAIEVVEKNISDPDLDIDIFTAEIGVSRMQLYRKLHALTNMTVKEFIRDIRLKRAAQMLVQKKMNVSEVAYAVGFKYLSHFRKCFHQEFNMSASEYIIKHSQDKD